MRASLLFIHTGSHRVSAHLVPCMFIILYEMASHSNGILFDKLEWSLSSSLNVSLHLFSPSFHWFFLLHRISAKRGPATARPQDTLFMESLSISSYEAWIGSSRVSRAYLPYPWPLLPSRAWP